MIHPIKTNNKNTVALEPTNKHPNNGKLVNTIISSRTISPANTYQNHVRRMKLVHLYLCKEHFIYTGQFSGWGTCIHIEPIVNEIFGTIGMSNVIVFLQNL